MPDVMPAFAAPPALPDVFPGTIQTLAPAAAHFCLHIARFTEKELGVTLKGKKILVGFSGGADSTALLLILRYLAPGLHFKLTAAHLDHSLRPSSSLEAEACAALCERLEIPCIVERADIHELAARWKIGTEESARRARYDFYDKGMKDTHSDLLALGHQNNDLAEDTLMRLIRGTGWPALGGMPGADPRRRLVRPLLLTPRRDLEAFLEGLGVTWVTDSSNTDPAYFRNRVRGTLLPVLLEENPAFLQAAANLWRLARLDAEYFNSVLPHPTDAGAAALPEPEEASQIPLAEPASMDIAVQAFGEGAKKTTPAESLLPLPKALRLRLYRRALEGLEAGQTPLAGLFALDEAWLRNPEPTTHLMSGGVTATVRKKGIVWRRNRKT